MKYFKDAQNTVYAYESDGSQDAFIKPGLMPITADQANALLNPVPIVPSVISMRQARQALYQSGLLDQANSFIAAIPGSDGDKARIAWEYAGDVERANQLVGQIGASLGLSDQQVDDLFTLGASL
jgi:hypothetical protein